eukprot:7378991-Prymnesium_polylepis.2
MLFTLMTSYKTLDENYSRRDLLDWQRAVLAEEGNFDEQGLAMARTKSVAPAARKSAGRFPRLAARPPGRLSISRSVRSAA